MRIGQGFDLHRLEEGRPFRLGGVLLDWPKGPHGHSDGDVLLHAVVDALLGASGLGDIGEWFSPLDARWQGADSTVFLKTVLERLWADGWEIVNVDSTVMLEVPKLSPYKAPIREHLAGLLGVDIRQVSLKAKTMEGLGPIGQQEAVAAMVSVLIQASREATNLLT